METRNAADPGPSPGTELRKGWLTGQLHRKTESQLFVIRLGSGVKCT
jgi:hypothetical protein